MYVIITFSFQLVLDIFQIGPSKRFYLASGPQGCSYSLSQVFSILGEGDTVGIPKYPCRHKICHPVVPLYVSLNKPI